VRVGLARRVDGGWREVDELRLDETDFWRTVSGPRALCLLALGTAGTQRSFRPYLTVQVLLSPSLGCGRAYRIPLPLVSGSPRTGPIGRLARLLLAVGLGYRLATTLRRRRPVPCRPSRSWSRRHHGTKES